MNLLHIAQGWKNVMTSANPNLALQRLEICDSCPNKRQLSPAGAWLLSKLNAESSVFYCAACGCPLASKATVKGEKCPNGLWPEEPSYY